MPTIIAHPVANRHPRGRVPNSGAGPRIHLKRMADTTSLRRAPRSGSPSFVSSLRFADFRLPGLLSLMLLMSAVVLSHRQVFWIDETYAWNLIHDPSLRHANSALAQAADGGLPTYYNLAWVWARMTGGSVLALRLFSTTAVVAGLWVLWAAFRKVYREWPAAVALLAIFGGSNLLLRVNAELRFYGLYFALACAVFAAGIALARGSCARRLLVALLLNALLVYTHVFGFVYSALMLAGLVAADLYLKRFRIGTYATWAASWLLLLMWLRPLQRLADTGKPHGYIPVPHLKELAIAYTFRAPLLGVLLVVVIGMGLLRRRGAQGEASGAETGRERRVTAVAMAGFLLVLPAVAYAISQVRTPIFEMRYFLPSLIGVAVVLAELARWGMGPKTNFPAWMRMGMGAVVALCALYPLVYAKWSKVPGFQASAVAALEAYHLPVEVEDAHYFYPMEFLAGADKNEFFYPLDYEDSLRPGADRGGTLDVNIARILRREGYYPGQIVAGDAPVCAPRFLVIDSSDLYWYERHIENNDDYKSQVLGAFPASDRPEPKTRLVLVTRTRPCGAAGLRVQRYAPLAQSSR
jgi:hypothetical protein